MKKLSDLKLILMWAIVIPVVLSGCNSHHENVDSSSFDVMVGILKSVSVHPSKIEVITNNHSSGSNASITRKYKSDAPYIHMHIEYPPKIALSELVKRLKGRSSRILQQEYPNLRKRYWGRHFWAIGYGAWSTGTITDEVVQQYLEHHRNKSNEDNDSFILD